MNPPREALALGVKRFFQVSLFCLAAVFLVKFVLVPGAAQSTGERELEDKIPKHLPIKVKIKKEKEKAFKDSKNEKWLRDFELEITNTGEKPIYFLSLTITSEIPAPQQIGPTENKMGFSIYYGRSELGDIVTKAGTVDIPINPGETYVFKFPDSEQLDWDRFREKENKPDAKKLILKFQILSFGDGTGFWGNEGMAVPRAPDEKSGLGRCEPKRDLNDPGGLKIQRASWISQPETLSVDNLPAGNLLANLLFTDSSRLTSRKLNPQPEPCCSGNGCFRSRPYVSACLCGPRNLLDNASCSDPLAACRLPTYIWRRCGDGYCVQADYVLCGSTTPTPTPPGTTPTPPGDTHAPVRCEGQIQQNPHCECLPNPLGGYAYFCPPCPGGV